MSRHPAPVIGAALLGVLVLAAIWGYPRTPRAVNDRFEMRLASEEPRAGYSAANTKIHARTIYLAPTAALSCTDVARIGRLSEADGRESIAVDFTAAGRRRLADVTRKNLHELLAIVVDGRVLLAPRIEAEIAGGRVEITGAFTRQQLDQIMQAVSPGL